MANINGNSLFLIQNGDTSFSIKASELKTYFSPLAKQKDNSLSILPAPGIMFPSEQFIYNRATGELSLAGDNNVVKELYGFIGYKENFPDDDKNNYVTSPSMDGSEPAGAYYIVIDSEYKYLTNDWGTGYYDPNASPPGPGIIQRVYVGDEMHKQINGDWKHEPNPLSANVFMFKALDSYQHISEIVEI